MSGAYVLLDQLVDAGGAVWRASWQASVLAVLVLAVQLMLGNRLPARWRHAMWMLVLLRLALPVVPSSPMSVFNLAPKVAPSRAVAPVVVNHEATPIPRGGSVVVVPPQWASQDETPSSATPQAAEPAWSAWDVLSHWREILASVWALGAVVLALRIAWATIRVSRMLRTLERVDEPAIIDVLRATATELGVRRSPQLLAGDGFFSPALVGAIRPKLLVPVDVLERFDPAELRLVFLHELAHLKRRDVAINWFATALTTLHWLNPVAWLVSWRLRIERELACDELVMSRTTDADRRAYGHTIVKLLEALAHGGSSTSLAQPLPAGGVGILEGKEQMKRRIVMIAQFARCSRTWTFVALGIVLTLGLVAMTDAVQAEDTAKPAAQPAGAHAPEGPATGLPVDHLGERLERARQSPKIEVGELVTISIMNLMGANIETVKTTRVDADGNINLPYVKEIKAEGLRPAELEEAVAKAFKQKAVMDDAVVAVSRPERGESHQLAKVREPAVAAGPIMGRDPAIGDSGMMDPGMMGFAVPSAPAPAAPIDPAIQKTLDRKLPEAKFVDVPLTEVFSFLGDVSSANLFVNWRGLEAAGVDRNAPVSLNVKDVALKDVIALVLKQQDSGLACTVENGVITIDVPNQPARSPKQVTKAYNVDDLITSGGTKELVRTVYETVAPNSWREQGGTGNISAYGSKLIITASEENHHDVASLLDMLRDKPATQPASTRVEKTAR